MRILADLRCLQDPRFAARGVGSHAAHLLDTIRTRVGSRGEIVGLVDHQLPPLPIEYAETCSIVRSVFAADDSVTPTVFIEFSPMTHDTIPPARLLDRPNVLPTAVIYDFIPRDHPDRYLSDRSALCSYAAALKWLAAYRGFFPISEHAASQLRDVVDIPGSFIAVTGVAIRPGFTEHLHDTQRLPLPATVSNKGHLLFVGGPDPRKNLDTVVAAYHRIAAVRESVPQLVVVGGYSDEWQRRVLAEIPPAVRRGPGVVFLDHVPDQQLAGLYAHSRITIVASLAEGFSMPIVESMAAGAAVLASDIPAHRELVNDPAARFQPLDAAELAIKIGVLLDSDAIRTALATSQRPVADRFSATSVGDRFWAGLCSWFGGSAGRSPRYASRRPAVAIVTPFPPDRSGVADYSLKCVEALARRVDVDVYTDQTDPVPCAGVRDVQPISAAAWLRPDYAATVAVIGNSHFHERIVAFHQRFGGACILHDNRMLDFYRWCHGEHAVQMMAERSLGRAITAEEVKHWLDNPESLPTLFFDQLLARAHPAIVHSRALAHHIRRFHGARVEVLPFCVHRLLQNTPTHEGTRLQARRHLGIPDDVIFIVTFGMVTPAKKPETLVEAINILRRSGLPAHLRFVGDADALKSELRARVTDESAISFSSGWVSEQEYLAHLQAADFAIQLRTHRFGGLSGAVNDCIAAGLPTIVNDGLAQAFDAPSYLLRVSDTLCPLEVSRVLDEAICRKQSREHHEQERLAYLESHSFDRYADQLLDALGVTRPRSPVENAPRRVVDYVQGPLPIDDSPLWDVALDATLEERNFVARVVTPVTEPRRTGTRSLQIHYWVNSTPGYPANTGIQRVVRQMARALQGSGAELIPVCWDSTRRTFVRPSHDELVALERWNGPTVRSWSAQCPLGPNQWLLIPEIPVELDGRAWNDMFSQARCSGTRIAAVFYDAIPLKMAGLYKNADTRCFHHWIRQLAEADLVVPISRPVATDLAWLWSRDRALPQIPDSRIRPLHLPGGFSTRPRVVEAPPRRERLTLLSVGTLEPRKNQERLIEAFARAARRCPRLDQLVLVGSRRAFDRRYVDRVLAAVKRHTSVSFCEEPTDDELQALYDRSDFTIFPSLEEGYGLPILESIWHGRPCICGNSGVTAELAAGGGCLPVDVRNIEHLATAMERLAGDEAGLAALTSEALARPLPTWGDYVTTLLGLLSEHMAFGEKAA